MSFLTAQTAELTAAAGKLGVIGSTWAAQNAAAAAPTTGVIPAAADEVSVLQASLFSAYGTLYQQVSGEATAMYDSFVSTLQTSAGTYEATEAANSSAAASPLSSAAAAPAAAAPAAAPAAAAPAAAAPDIPGSDIANILDIGAGNWGSAASNFVGLANGALLPAEQGAIESVDTLPRAGASLGSTATGVGMAPIAPIAGVGTASSIGALSAPPSWAGSANLVSRAGVATSAGWTAAVPEAAPPTMLAGMPFAATGRNSAGFGAPRYGVKPLVMPKPTAV